MNYVVVDLEWNQAMSSKSSVFNYLPIHLRGQSNKVMRYEGSSSSNSARKASLSKPRRG